MDVAFLLNTKDHGKVAGFEGLRRTVQTIRLPKTNVGLQASDAKTHKTTTLMKQYKFQKSQRLFDHFYLIARGQCPRVSANVRRAGTKTGRCCFLVVVADVIGKSLGHNINKGEEPNHKKKETWDLPPR